MRYFVRVELDEDRGGKEYDLEIRVVPGSHSVYGSLTIILCLIDFPLTMCGFVLDV